MKTRIERGLSTGGAGILPVRPRAGSPCHGKSRSAFTLIELLVVVGIIALLMGITIPVVSKAIENARKAQARTELKTIETAVRAYFNEYSRFPHGSGQPDRQYLADNRELVNALRSINGPGNVNHANNVRRIAFMEVADKSLDNQGNFVDPWGRHYRVFVDTDFNNEVDTSAEFGIIQNRIVAAWSMGPEDDMSSAIKSWE